MQGDAVRNNLKKLQEGLTEDTPKLPGLLLKNNYSDYIKSLILRTHLSFAS